jgi:hypothetical protein
MVVTWAGAAKRERHPRPCRIACPSEAKMRIAHPNFIANEKLLWIKKDATEVVIQAFVGVPYQYEEAWACPAALMGLDDRYPDLIGESSIQSLTIALRLIRQRLGHLVDIGDVLVYPNEKNTHWSSSALDAVFGKF